LSMTDDPDADGLSGGGVDRWADPAGTRPMGWELALWIMALMLPLAALGLLLAAPELDPRWEHHPWHFWLVLAVAVGNVVVGLYASEAASRRDHARTFLVSMTLLTSAGFLGLHALATPGVLLDDLTAGFSLAARVGLLVAAGFAALSAVDPGCAGRWRVKELRGIGWGFIPHSSSPQYRRNENSNVDCRRTRAIPCLATSMISGIVSRHRLASSTSFRLAHSPSTGSRSWA
jgi:hypothetical protein